MPERITNKKIETLGDLRKFIKTLDDLEDDYKISFDDLPYSVELLADCDISYSSKEMSIDCVVVENWLLK